MNEVMSEYGKILQMNEEKECKFSHPCFAFTIAWWIPISTVEFSTRDYSTASRKKNFFYTV